MTDYSNEDKIRSLVENWARAVREGDINAVLACHSDDIVMFDVPPPLEARGLDAYRRQWALFFAYSPGGKGSFDVVDLEVTAGGKVAYCHALIQIFTSKVRLTMGFRKIEGKWLITHEHHSSPIALEARR
jgi:uncharacterized protein (TIGR02246 family)